MTDINVSLKPVNFTVSTDLEGACFISLLDKTI